MSKLETCMKASRITITRGTSPEDFEPRIHALLDGELWFSLKMSWIHDIIIGSHLFRNEDSPKELSYTEAVSELVAIQKNEFPDKDDLVDEAFKQILEVHETYARLQRL